MISACLWDFLLDFRFFLNVQWAHNQSLAHLLMVHINIVQCWRPIFTYTVQPPCGHRRNCHTREWHIFSRHASWWKWLEKQRKLSYVFFFFFLFAHLVDFYCGCTLASQHQSSPITHGKFISKSTYVCVCVCVHARVWVCVCVCVNSTFMCAQSVCLIEWPPSTLFKGKTRELSQRITGRRMQQLMCASCTVFLYLETTRTHGGWWLWSVWRKDRMFCCFNPLSSVR